ncbi:MULTISPECIES: DUF4097 family beta strand repeat-containing protein [Streptomyces]|uniref:DUF4097 family beta strand repeat-containing protein n=1 Tax=Streptomyces lienomycini TaxID=284035 RepID=A0ABV9X6Q2_9ACTN|nr:DUF4097 family beta strand repeat-containing protein [Streptomyces sp. NBC_00334]
MPPFFRPAAPVCGALLLALAATGCSETSSQDGPERQAFAVTGEQLTVVSDNSRLELTAADVDKVEVAHWYEGWSTGGDIKPVTRWEGGELRLDIDCGGLLKSCDSRYEVKVPRGLRVSARSENKTVTADGFKDGLTLRSDNGDVRAGAVSGPLELRSSNGSVTGEAVASDTVEAVAENKAVRLDFERAPSAVDAASSNGSVRVSVPRARYAVEATSGGGDVEVSVPRDDGSGKRITAHSDNKKVSVVPADSQ